MHPAAGDHGILTGTTHQVVNYGTDGTQSREWPATGYHFVDWSDDGLTANPLTDTNVMADVNVTANFADITAPGLTITGFTADGAAMLVDAPGGYSLPTTNIATSQS